MRTKHKTQNHQRNQSINHHKSRAMNNTGQQAMAVRRSTGLPLLHA